MYAQSTGHLTAPWFDSCCVTVTVWRTQMQTKQSAEINLMLTESEPFIKGWFQLYKTRQN